MEDWFNIPDWNFESFSAEILLIFLQNYGMQFVQKELCT